MLTWEQEHAVSPEHYDGELHGLIEDFLWKSSPHRNELTLLDLERKQQQRPGIVSLDGVIIDGNRRAMLLRKLEQKKNQKQWFDAIILPDAYGDNEKEIVRLETQYQIGEDSKVEYGPLQKYLHARRLCEDLAITKEEVDKLMGEPKGTTARLLRILELMDEYLQHIGCPKLYTVLKDKDGTKEGMFVDLANDLKRLEAGAGNIQWAYDQVLEPLYLKLVQFDYIRFGEFQDANKSYREISHQSKGNNFFSHEDIWEQFRTQHQERIDPITQEMGTLEEYIAQHGSYQTKVEAARARDADWREKVKAPIQENFGKSSSTLEYRVSEYKPRVYLERAKLALEKVDMQNPAFLADPANSQLVREVNRLSYEMKKMFDRA
jgi:hypothetical protein